MNAIAPTRHGSTASVEGGPGSSSDADNPPEPITLRPEVRCAADVVAQWPALDLPWVADRLGQALREIDAPPKVSVLIVTAAKIRSLNRMHRGVRETTDVLTFEVQAEGEPAEADIVVCADVAARQAAKRKHSIERELLLYATHGVLHCCGFEDETPRGCSAIHAEEDRILAAIGVGPTYARDLAGHDDDRAPGAVTEEHKLD